MNVRMQLDDNYYFGNTRNMEIKNTVRALSALAQETRLSIYRLLVEVGPEGMSVGAIAEKLGLPNATLSFHLKELANADLIVTIPNGRSIICSANFKAMNQLVDYLTENCCAGASCATTVKCKPKVAPKLKKRAA
jgi:ArsR family transcriptional regulator, arsenate/arsenite/antimonite-responsive transcriptional repressor